MLLKSFGQKKVMINKSPMAISLALAPKGPSSGYSLVALLIAITMSLFLSGIFLNLFIQNRSFYTTKNTHTDMGHTAHFLEYNLSRLARNAAHRSPPAALSTLFSLSVIFPSTAPYITGVAASSNTTHDSITFRFQGDSNGTITDCANAAVSNQTISFSTITVNANQQLICSTANTLNNPMVLADNIGLFRVLYGEDLNSNGTASRYIPADYPGLNMARVVSVRFGFMLQSTNNQHSLQNTPTYTILNTITTPPNDGRLRDVFSFTVQLRNVPRYET
jgi:hypothetical protein